jgi:hypothetical protein
MEVRAVVGARVEGRVWPVSLTHPVGSSEQKRFECLGPSCSMDLGTCSEYPVEVEHARKNARGKSKHAIRGSRSAKVVAEGDVLFGGDQLDQLSGRRPLVVEPMTPLAKLVRRKGQARRD